MEASQICLRRSQPAHAGGLRTAPTDFTGLVHQAQVCGHLRCPCSGNRKICLWWQFKIPRSGGRWLFPKAMASFSHSQAPLDTLQAQGRAQPAAQAPDPAVLSPARAHSPARGRTTRRRCPGGPWPPWWGGWRRPAAAWGWAAPRPAGSPGNSGTGTDPSGTAPGSAPTRRSASGQGSAARGQKGRGGW